MWKIHRLSRTDFPNVPDEIFTGFVEPLSNADWNTFDETAEGRWYYHFGSLSLKEFNNLRWDVSPIVIRSTSFHPESKLDIYLIDYFTPGDTIETRTRFIGYPTDSRERLILHIKFIIDITRNNRFLVDGYLTL